MSLVQAYLFAGAQSATIERVQRLMQERLCKARGCGICFICNAIIKKEYYNLMWISPEKGYTRDLMEPLFRRIAFKQDPTQPFFIVLEQVDFLTQAVGNSLLKSLEEPPAGYYFLLLASSVGHILPTIVSRCVVEECDGIQEFKHYKTCIDYFCFPEFSSLSQFQKDIAAVIKHDRDIQFVFEAVYKFWVGELKKAYFAQDYEKEVKIKKVIMVLERHKALQPVYGSAKVFFKNLYIQILDLITNNEILKKSL